MGKREVPRGKKTKTNELGFVQNQPVVGFVEASSHMQTEMARDGLRYGDPSLPRYATGRVDGRAPSFPNASPDLSVAKNGEQFRASGILKNRQPHKTNRPW